KLGGKATQLFREKDHIIFVRDTYELLQVVDNFNYAGYTMRLAGNIALTGDLVFDKPVNLDLAGYAIDCGAHSIIFDYESSEASRLFSSRPSVSGIFGGTLTAYTPSGVVINEGVFNGSSYTVTAASFDIFKELYQSYLNALFEGGVRQGALDIVGDFGELNDYFNLSFFSSDTDIIGGDFSVTAPIVTQYVILDFLFALPVQSFSFEVQVWGATDAIIEQIVQENFYFLEGNFQPDYVAQIARDILLPQNARSVDACILWISSDREILSESGRFSAPYWNTEIELSAVISVNGVNIMRTFAILAIAKTPQEKLHEMCQTYVREHGMINFVEYEQEVALPIVTHYPFMQGAALDFSIPDTVDDFFILDKVNGLLTLMTDTDIEHTALTVAADFGEGVIVYDTIDVQVSILRTISYWEAAYRYLLTYVDDLEENIMEGFEVPATNEDEVTIAYDVPLGAFGIYYNPTNANEYVKISAEGTQIIILKDKLPPVNTQITIRATITHIATQVAEERFFTITVAGVLRYDIDGVADINLYQELRKLYDTNDDWYITHEEVDTLGLESIVIRDHNIQSIKGLEYFTDLKSINLSDNVITDLSPLSNLFGIVALDLSHNSVLDISALKNLTLLQSLNLSYNGVTAIESLKSMRELEELYLDNNAFLRDFAPLEQLVSLKTLTAYTTPGTVEDAEKNESFFITAYRNALLKFAAEDISHKIYSSSNDVPGPNQTEAGKILSMLRPVYEFQNVIYLPYRIKYGAVYYDVVWRTGNDSIVRIEADRAYITRPVADINVSLGATIIYNTSYTLTRFFDVLSISNDPALKLLTDIDASVAIKDETLRYKLFEIFDDDGNKTIDATEISQPRGDIDFLSLGITDLTGIGYFAQAITSLDLRNNAYADLTPLQSLTELTSLHINNSSTGLVALKALRNLNFLSVYGLNDVNTTQNLATLYDVYLNNPGITIYKDSLHNVWDPYIEPMTKALTKLQGNYLLYAGTDGRTELETALEVVMYNGTPKPVTVSYSKDRGSFSLSTTTLYLNYSAIPARNDYGLLNAIISIETTSVTRKLMVISVSETELYLEVDTDDYELLTDAVPNESARRAFIGRLSNSVAPPTAEYEGIPIRYIAKSRYMAIENITFNAMGMSGVKGIGYLKGSTKLTQLTYNGYVYKGASSHFL
ncbi:MAG: leucine-rich repeat domain-containing protein, partial [Clostridia bacterium]|nr:leucine-rich repeat domain-containing protein [Clostridia bacterium]